MKCLLALFLLMVKSVISKPSKFCHPYAITRRGYGASSRPDSGYTEQRLAEDMSFMFSTNSNWRNPSSWVTPWLGRNSLA